MTELTLKSGTKLPIINLKGKDYLQVAHRLVWFREERPLWSIETDFTIMTDQNAFCKATIRDESGRVIATSHKEESLKDFPAGFREKAETGAIGRALALCGFGTQFEPELNEGQRVVDSPISKTAPWMENPPVGEFQEDTTWRFTFGKWKNKTIEQVYRDQGPEQLASYIDWLESSAQKKGEPLSASAQDVVSQIESFLGAMENREPGSEG